MGIYELTRVPFGPKNASSWYQQLMAGVVLAGILYLICEIYVDDCIVYGETQKSFSQTCEKYLNALENSKLL